MGDNLVCKIKHITRKGESVYQIIRTDCKVVPPNDAKGLAIEWAGQNNKGVFDLTQWTEIARQKYPSLGKMPMAVVREHISQDIARALKRKEAPKDLKFVSIKPGDPVNIDVARKVDGRFYVLKEEGKKQLPLPVAEKYKPRPENESYFGWKPVIQNMHYSAGRYFDDQPMEEELYIVDGSKQTDIAIPFDTIYTAERILSPDATPLKAARIDAHYQGKRYLVFPDTVPCAPEFYMQPLCGKKDADREEAFSCFPVERSFHCAPPKGVYYGQKGRAIAGDFMWAAKPAARYYAGILGDEVKKGNVEVTRGYNINREGGDVEEWRAIRYKSEAHKQEEKWYGKGGRMGMQKPEFPIDVGEIFVSDKDNNGTTDYAEADWVGATGSLRVGRRSSYTQGLLTYFDGVWSSATTNTSRYRTATVPSDFKMKKGDTIHKGEALFSYPTKTGNRTFYSEFDGTVRVSEISTERGLYLETEKKDIGLLKSLAHYAENLWHKYSE